MMIVHRKDIVFVSPTLHRRDQCISIGEFCGRCFNLKHHIHSDTIFGRILTEISDFFCWDAGT